MFNLVFFVVPDNKFEKSGQVVVEENRVTNIGQTTVELPVKLAFFEDQLENGIPVENGVLVFAKTKDPYSGMLIFSKTFEPRHEKTCLMMPCANNKIRRSACASTQSDQCLCCWLLR